MNPVVLFGTASYSFAEQSWARLLTVWRKPLGKGGWAGCGACKSGRGCREQARPNLARVKSGKKTGLLIACQSCAKLAYFDY